MQQESPAASLRASGGNLFIELRRRVATDQVFDPRQVAQIATAAIHITGRQDVLGGSHLCDPSNLEQAATIRAGGGRSKTVFRNAPSQLSTPKIQTVIDPSNAPWSSAAAHPEWHSLPLLYDRGIVRLLPNTDQKSRDPPLRIVERQDQSSVVVKHPTKTRADALQPWRRGKTGVVVVV